MGKLHTFKGLIEEQCFDDIFEALNAYIEQNPDKFAGESNTIDDPDEAELSDMRMQFVTVHEHPNNHLKFEVVVSAEIEISQRMPHSYSDSDGITQWFSVECSAELKDGLNHFQIYDIEIYYRHKQKKEGKLSEYLVPITYKEMLDDVAEDFLSRHYPEALEKPVPIKVEDLVERMGLSIEYIHLSKTCTVFGQIYFADAEAKFYDSEDGVYKQKDVQRGTIIVDPNVFFMRNVGSVNNTIIHECVHWDRHSLFFELEKIFNPISKAITCQVKEGKKTENDGTPYEWMEWQANHLAPRILMPAKTTKQKIEELIEKNEKILPDAKRVDIIESVIFELKEFFGVSIMSAKIRMIDLGYKEAEGVYTYVDNHYVLNHSFELSALQRGQTYTISAQDALIEYATNLNFRAIIDSGSYVFVDNHFCINDSKYIKFDEIGSPKLTDYALQNMDECCFVFDFRLRDNKAYGIQYYSECTLFKSAISNKIVETYYDPSEHNDEIVQRAMDLRETVADIVKIRNSLPAEFSKTLKAHMKRKGCTVEKLAELSLIGPKTIQRMRNEEDYPVEMHHVVALCVGMQLHPIFSRDLLKKAGKSFKGTELHITYELIIDSLYPESIHYCNEILNDNNLPLLGTEDLK